jgi:hypothetical protein
VLVRGEVEDAIDAGHRAIERFGRVVRERVTHDLDVEPRENLGATPPQIVHDDDTRTLANESANEMRAHEAAPARHHHASICDSLVHFWYTRRVLTRLRVLVVSRPVHALTIALALAFAWYVIVYPLTVVTYPPLTDLPFHAASMEIIGHYIQPNLHFKEQFSLHPLASPYITFYVIGAIASMVLPIDVAVKVATVAMLGLLPAGLAVFFHGMKKSPFLGLLGLGLVWSNLTHWGFLPFMGAIGLYAMSLGLTLMLLDRPTRSRSVLLTFVLAEVFFTHVFRFPFALLSVVATAVVMYPATKRWKPIIAPLAINTALFGVWRLVRGDAYESEMGSLAFDATHWNKPVEHLVGGFGERAGETELALFEELAIAVGVIALVAAIFFFLSGRTRPRSRRRVWWGIGVTVLPLLLAGGFMIGYFVLPYRIGNWWYVFPRELTPAVFVALGAMPDLPRAPIARLAGVLAIGLFTSRVAYFVAERFDAFEELTADFRRIEAEIPRGSKLLYLVYDKSGFPAPYSRLVHLPAWSQAEHGGWLSFHFASWDFSPVRYRKGGIVPPKTPPRWEWEPDQFRVREHGAWFDEFLVRDQTDPSWRFADDRSIRLVGSDGTWLLYHRVR